MYGERRHDPLAQERANPPQNVRRREAEKGFIQERPAARSIASRRLSHGYSWPHARRSSRLSETAAAPAARISGVAALLPVISPRLFGNLTPSTLFRGSSRLAAPFGPHILPAPLPFSSSSWPPLFWRFCGRLSERKRKESLRLQAALSDCIARIQERASSIISVYEDEDGLKREETLYLGGQRQLRRVTASGSSTDVWVNFYDRIKEIRGAHKRRQIERPEDAQVPTVPRGVDEILQEFMETPYLDALFEDAESFGRLVSLDASYRSFCGLKKIQRHFIREAKEKEARYDLARLRKKGASEEVLADRSAALDEEIGGCTMDYLSYLRTLGDFTRIPRHLKYKQQDYREYLQGTLQYLEDFFFRRNPLADADKVRETVLSDFERQFAASQVNGWEEKTHSNPLYCRVTDRLFANPNTYASHQQVCTVSLSFLPRFIRPTLYSHSIGTYPMPVPATSSSFCPFVLLFLPSFLSLRDADCWPSPSRYALVFPAAPAPTLHVLLGHLYLISCGLISLLKLSRPFCPLSVVAPLLCSSEGACAVHYAMRTLQGSAYKKKLLAAASLSAEEIAAATKRCEDADRQLAVLEFSIKAYADMLQEPINMELLALFLLLQQTIAFYQKKQSTTAEEALEQEDDDSEIEEDAQQDEEDSEAEEEEGPVYNPLNLPLGFDGRPIPYWLYKLHGLGQEFKCEICGNFSYWGRRAFERHFSEWRHSFGMRCLKIPNTTHFKEITKIEDAILLYERLKKQAEGNAFKQDQELECEDADGNVMNLRAFEDLRRQGLI
ncbi:splicing factor 3a [Cyclospora cayetanensis]|uniref:Splicing factor 3a n=1 Tax=Cyclospora cayetanensis TaxID=88456 RepID=A0A1D3DA45_9EIME|nr:splicing factor 3a [Cyclospora cayetanensis]